jgi:hypothetical protein
VTWSYYPAPGAWACIAPVTYAAGAIIAHGTKPTGNARAAQARTLMAAVLSYPGFAL